MVFMQHFCFYCSVRLGSIIMGVFSLIQGIIPLVYLLLFGEDKLNEQIAFVEENIENFDDEDFFMFFYEYIKNYKDQFLMGVLIYLTVHCIACIVMIIGALKILKWLVLPYIFTELIRLLVLLGCHVITMMVMKKQFDLGLLICVTVGGGFVLLGISYMWACVVALFQIIGIVSTEKYKQTFGTDGQMVAKHLKSSASSITKVENAIIYTRTNYGNTYTPDKNLSVAKSDRNKIADDGNMFTRDFLEVQSRQVGRKSFL